LPGDVPAGVDFRGHRPLAEVARLYDTHDLFVMPSRLEAFGIVFAEAVARGLPCIGRDAFAMPEVIEPGVAGALVNDDDPVRLAEVVARTLVDDSLYAKCREHAGESAAHFSWDRAGYEAVAAISRSLRA
jgi:glycosyltransferase involved in cell wall biosynthesis